MEDLQTQYINLINLLSFYIGLVNLKENLTQNDKQELENVFSQKMNGFIEQVESHLAAQDQKMDQILEILKEKGEQSNDRQVVSDTRDSE